LAVIEVEDLWFTYPGSTEPTLRGINLRIEEGDLLAIVGENGAGKTTLAKHFIGLLKPQRGSVKVCGLDVSKAKVSQLARHVGFVFQSPDHQLFSETVEEEVAFAPKNLGYPKEETASRVERVLKRLGLEGFRGRSPLTLSSGERRRVALASILSYDPRVLILDEPTVGQDAAQKRELAHIVKNMVEEGRTVVVITHDMDFVADHISRVVVLSRGRVVADGRVEEILVNEELLKASSLLLPPSVELSLALARRGLLPSPRLFRDYSLFAKELVEGVLS